MREGPGYVTNVSGTRTGLDQYEAVPSPDQRLGNQRNFPPLPGFAPPVSRTMVYLMSALYPVICSPAAQVCDVRHSP